MSNTRHFAVSSCLSILSTLHFCSSSAFAAPREQGVQFEGCIVDNSFRPLAGRPVIAQSSAGQILAQASTNVHGEFTIRVPAAAIFRIAYAGTLTPVLRSDDKDVWMSYCLQQQQD
jgi:hypothetical protein